MDGFDEIKELMKTNFKVTQIQVKDLKKFKKYCKEECGNVYSVGIIQLLKTKEKYEDLIHVLSHIQIDYEDLKNRLDKLENIPKEDKLKTFGEF